MKKTLFMAGLVLMSTACFAQKANVNRAKNAALEETPNYDLARKYIGEALENPETMDQANTWYVAGLIGSIQVEKLNMSQMMGQQIDERLKGQVATESYDLYMKADELAQKQMVDKKGNPMVDKKGNPVIDTKTRKLIAQKMLDFYQNQDFIKYGIFLNEQRDFQAAYEAFEKHLSIPGMDMFDAKQQAKMPKDTIYQQYQYYAALFAIQAENHPAAIALLENLQNGEYEAMTCAQFLYQEYVNVKDTANFVRVLKESMVKWPSEPWFLQNLINYYIFANQESEAVAYLNQAIEQDPTVAQYFLIRGNLEENLKQYDAALVDFEKALALDPAMADAEAGKGRVYYNQAVKVNEDAAYLDGNAYKEALKNMNDLFMKSVPYFEKAHQMAPDNRDYMITLKTLYYRFSQKDAEMEKKYNAIMEELNN